MAGFKYKKSFIGENARAINDYIIGDTQTLVVGYLVNLATGYLNPADTTERLLGVVVGFVDAQGRSLDDKEADYDGTYTASSNTYVSAADNTTDKKIRALVDISPYSIYSATPDATIGTTTGSNLPGYYCDTSTSAPDESGASTSAAQLNIWGLDPDDSTKGLYSIAEHQLFGL
jgi:hypothetical protein